MLLSGISDIVFTLINNVQARPDCNVIISRCDAYEFLSESKSEIESITSKYYEIIATSSKYTGYTADITLSDMFDRITDSFGEPSAILGSVTSLNTSSSPTGPTSVDTDTIAGETTSNSGESSNASTNIDVVGLAVFKGDVLVGELTAMESLCHLILTNRMEECILSVPSPFDENSIIDLYITYEDKTKNSVELINGSPFISTNVHLNAKVLSASKTSNFFEEDNLKLVEEYANSYIQHEIENYLYKVSKEYGADIDLFGRYAVKYFSTWDQWMDYNWLDNFQNAFFKVDAKIEVVSSYLIS